MQIHDTRLTAQAVEALLKLKLQALPVKATAYLGAYQCSPEQGSSLTVINDGNQALFLAWTQSSECDRIVVYKEDHDPMQGVTKQMRQKATYHLSVEQAAEHLEQLVRWFLGVD